MNLEHERVARILQDYAIVCIRTVWRTVCGGIFHECRGGKREIVGDYG